METDSHAVPTYAFALQPLLVGSAKNANFSAARRPDYAVSIPSSSTMTAHVSRHVTLPSVHLQPVAQWADHVLPRCSRVNENGVGVAVRAMISVDGPATNIVIRASARTFTMNLQKESLGGRATH